MHLRESPELLSLIMTSNRSIFHLDINIRILRLITRDHSLDDIEIRSMHIDYNSTLL